MSWSSKAGRCFGRGDVLAEDGSLVASYAQEALLRLREAADHLDS
jgi:acyl-CoA thioesterase